MKYSDIPDVENKENGLYANIGSKIKIIALIQFIIMAIGGVIGGLAVLVDADDEEIIYGLLNTYISDICNPLKLKYIHS